MSERSLAHRKAAYGQDKNSTTPALPRCRHVGLGVHSPIRNAKKSCRYSPHLDLLETLLGQFC